MKFRHLFIGLMVSWLATVAMAVSTPTERLAELGITLQKPDAPVANYVPAVRVGNLVFLAGHLPRTEAGDLMKGKLGQDVSLEEAQEAARRTALALLGTLKREIGSIDRVKRIVRVEGFVNATPDFTSHSLVINGCSDLLVEIFGDKGRHARMAIGAGSLPLGVSVEIAMIVEVE